jgi:Xaa-Pro aminopeptidase
MTGTHGASVDDRLDRLAGDLRGAGVDAALITPGPDLRYLIGYDAVPLERLTCLIVRADGAPALVVPRLEVMAAQASPAAHLDIHPWGETQNPYDLVAELLPEAAVVAVDDHMWAAKVLGLRDAMPQVRQQLGGPILDRMRMIKEPREIEALARAGEAIDRVHAAVPGLLRPGRSERDVASDIAELIYASGHVSIDFIIVASGPNSASPHHEVSDRILQTGDAVVVDIGGTMPDGYRSDCTRTYALGDPGEEYRARYDVLLAAQEAAVNAVRPGRSCEQVDATARGVLARAGLAELFVHRTGHGIGLETHEAPYIVEGNTLDLVEGMAFSVEPGFYEEGRHGARIEDIVVVDADGVRVLNHQPRRLVIV